jgi:cyclophilin family peptidyl-prolyl cis-trans isomerase
MLPAGLDRPTVVRGRVRAAYGPPTHHWYRARLVATDKRARQKELRNTRLEAARIEAQRTAKRRRLVRFSAPILAVAILVALLAIFDSPKSNTASKKTTTTTAATGTTVAGQTTTTSGAKPVTLTGPGGGATLAGDTPCPKADGSSPRTTGFAKIPGTCIDASKTYTATFDTTKGTMVVTLDSKDSPKTVNNFVVLSLYHFYDGTPFFRLVKDFAAQFGDPSTHPSNQAQFGYTIPDELPAKGAYKVGTLAMANTGQPNSGGAQAFFITGDQGVGLAPSYAIVGQVTTGLDVLQSINAVPSVQAGSNDGAPTEQVTINKITIAQS